MSSSPVRLLVTAVAAAVLFAPGCAASEPPPEIPARPAFDAQSRPHEHGLGRKSKHEHQFRGELRAYHDVMSPLWHAEPGRERIDRTCREVDTLRTLADAIARSSPPAGSEGDATAWTEAASRLADRTGRLAEACGPPGREEVEPIFTSVHEAFHEMMEVAGDQQSAGP